MAGTGSSDFAHRWVPVKGAGTTVLALHGTGGDENDLLPLVAAVAPGRNVLSPRGKVLEMGFPRFFRRLAEGVFDLADLVARTHELAEFVTEAARSYAFDPTNVLALGYSNGANIAASMLILRPEILSGAALLRPMKPFDPEDVDTAVSDLSRKPILVSAGRHDPIVPAASTAQLVEILRGAGANLSVHESDAGHELTHADLEAAARWFEER